MGVKALMQRTVMTIAADSLLRHARALIARYGIRHLPVVATGVLVGLLTDDLTQI